MTRYQPSTRNTRTERDGHAFAIIALIGVAAVLVVVAVLLASLYRQVADLNDHLDRPDTTPVQTVGGAR